MNRRLPPILVALSLTALSLPAFADSARLGEDLKQRQDQRVTVKLVSGDELTGIVVQVNNGVLQLRELAGREYFDALIDVEDVSAVIYRKK